jgi:hypothetical protein
LHYSNKIKPAKVETINFNCNCGIKCVTLFSEEQKQQFFDRHNSFKSDEQQYLFLKSMVIPVNNKNKKFEYFTETNCDKNKVKISLISNKDKDCVKHSDE